MLDDIEQLQGILKKLNKPRLGSFGECLYIEFLQSKLVKIEACHQGRIDYFIDGVPVDVKTSVQKIDQHVSRGRKYNGDRRDNNTKYVYVEFCIDGAMISFEGEIISRLGWIFINQIFQKWKVKRRGDGISQCAIFKDVIDRDKNNIKQFFVEKGIEARVIYRTCQEGFGVESPDTLKPKKIMEKRITVFLDYKDYKCDCLRMIISFPDSIAESLPMLEKVTLHRPKVDVARLPNKFVYRDIEDLRTNYQKMFSNHR